MTETLSVVNTDMTGLLQVDDISIAMSEVRAEHNDFLSNERDWLEANNPFYAMQLRGYFESAQRVLGDLGVAALKGVLVANRIVRHLEQRQAIEYSTVQAYHHQNLPIAFGRARAQMKWNPHNSAVQKVSTDAMRIFKPDIVAELDHIQTPPLHVGCVSGLVLSLSDSRNKLKHTVSIGH